MGSIKKGRKGENEMTEIEVLEKIAESLTWVQFGITVMAVIAGAAFILALLAWEEYR